MKYLIIALCFLLTSCGQVNQHYQEREKNWYTQNEKLKVLSTTAMIDDIVRQVGGDHIDTITLIRGELDPHTYQLVKGDGEKLAYADIIFYNGLGLEHGPSLQQTLHESSKAIPLGDRIIEQNPEQILNYNGQLDPHIWMDISLWSKIIPYIVETLSNKDPEHAATYQANGQQLQQQLFQTHEQVKNQLQQIPPKKRFLVTSHDAFNYFARAYLAKESEQKNDLWQKRFAAPEGLAPESQLSAHDIQLIIDHMRQYQITVLFPETNVSRDSIRKIVQAGREYGLELTIAEIPLYGDAMGEPGSSGDNYQKMLRHNANAITHYLDKQL